MVKLSDETREKLTTVSTATVATILFKRGLKNQYIQGVVPLLKGKPNMVGAAYTLRYIPAREDLNPITIFQDPKHPQRVAVEECPPGSILVIDSRKDARAASAGSILATRLMVRGVAGIVTDGGFRDSAEIAALAMSSYHRTPSAPTNLTLHQAIAINDPIGCGDVAVFPGDILLGDDDGVMVIPEAIVDAVAEEAIQMTLFENFVLAKVQAGQQIIGLYPLTNETIRAEFEAWKKA
ncbi:ribonuclease activity regulator RraA [Cellulophaga baltica]|uniref:ribonuclease activity regulator RraA n=1 Tax=Cellulophaga baltica TaxID=76594 RepID=UPI0037CBA759